MTEQNLPTHGRFVNLNGRKFGRLTVVGFGGMVVYKHGRKATWVCKCECGKTVRLLAANLVNGHTLSCGCLMIERTKAKNTRHGANRVGQRTAEYKIWAGIRKRCYDTKCNNFDNYGGRGITMSDEWRNDFQQFLNDMGVRPTESHSIDRKDVNGPYSKENCRWLATQSEQCRNKRNNRLLTFNGQTKCLQEWSEETEINPETISNRISRGWTIERALTTPVIIEKRNRHAKANKKATLLKEGSG